MEDARAILEATGTEKALLGGLCDGGWRSCSPPPIRHHFEQSFHVHHRLERYGAGRRMDFESDGPPEIAAAIADEVGREVDYRPVETDGAARAAQLIADLL